MPSDTVNVDDGALANVAIILKAAPKWRDILHYYNYIQGKFLLVVMSGHIFVALTIGTYMNSFSLWFHQKSKNMLLSHTVTVKYMLCYLYFYFSTNSHIAKAIHCILHKSHLSTMQNILSHSTVRII